MPGCAPQPARVPESLSEADTCRKHITPALYDAGWSDDQILQERTLTDGRIVPVGEKARRRKQKRADYLLQYRHDYPIAVVEAKAYGKTAGTGLQQAMAYAEMLSLKFAYATNGQEIIEHNYITGKETDLKSFPPPDELWRRLREFQGISDEIESKVLTPYQKLPGKRPRYYQQIAINRAVESVLKGRTRNLLTLATGTGKTFIAFQICWRLWSMRWNRTGDYRRPRILFLADRNVLVDDPKDKMFSDFGEARHKISGEAVMGREMYFSTYQAIARDVNRPGLFKEYPEDFFDLVVVDECHRGSARDDSNWREILTYFSPAFQIGMTATPLRVDNRDTYQYFGNPLYTYSLKQGIEDGFLAPYRVHRVATNVDALGWRPTKGQLDRYGREIPDGEYGTKDFERIIALKTRTEAIARNITEFLKKRDRFGKTIVFCVDQEHAEEMRKALNNLNADLVQKHPDYVARVVSDEGNIGRGHLSKFMDPEEETPAIVTSSQMLTTGVDAPTCRNVVLVRVINSMTEFKQIIGRGTRVNADYGKLFFNILDYTGSATTLFADPDFDGEPELISEEEMDEEGNPTEETTISDPLPPDPDDGEEENDDDGGTIIIDPLPPAIRKIYVDDALVHIVAHSVHELDADGKQLRVVKYTDYTGEKVRTLYPSAAALRSKWCVAEERALIIEQLEERGIAFEELAAAAKQPDADPFDLLCHVAFNAPLRTRRERAEMLRKEKKDFFDRYSPEARAVLDEMLDKYVEHGAAQFQIPDILKVAPISDRGNVGEIIGFFGDANTLRAAVNELQAQLYAA